MFKRNSFLCFCIIGLFTVGLSAVELSTDNDNVKLSVNGLGFFRFGQVVRGTGIAGGGQVSKIWTENANAGLSLEALIDEKLKIVAGMEAEMRFSWPMEAEESQTKIAHTVPSLREAYGLFTLDRESWAFDACAGYFEYKYNPDVRNLGEFLFRSATYPAYIITDFDYPLAKLLGLRLGNKLFDKSLSHDLILSSETVFYPAMDWSLSYLMGYDLLNKGFLQIGAGISFSHLLSVYPDNKSAVGSATSPRYTGSQGTQYITENGDTAYYSFKGTKAMGRLSIDPKFLFDRDNSFFGESDLKIYGEILILGLKSYPDTTLGKRATLSYANWKEKAPVTFGFNLPAFSLLDVFNLEFEYWGSKYYNDYRHLFTEISKPLAPSLDENITESKWKWSLYLKKSFFHDHITLTTQFARDHMRLWGAIYDRANHREMHVEAGNWWWVTKVGYSF